MTDYTAAAPSVELAATRVRAVPDDRVPTVSVVLPTYNRLPLLRDAVESVRAQTFSDWELIVVDDGSTDDTRTYLEQMRVEDPRIRPLFLQHTGWVPVTRGAGVQATRASWIAFLDSDDMWLPEKLQVQFEQLAVHPECDWSYTAYHHVDDAGHPIEARPAFLSPPVSGWIAERIVTFAVAASIVTVMVKRSLFQASGGFDTTLRLREDYDLVLRLAETGPACGVTQDMTVVREHPSRTTRTFSELAHLQAIERVFMKAERRATTARMRSACADQRASQWVSIARALNRNGRRYASFRALAQALRIAPRSLRIWRSVLGQTARSLESRI